jgi:hypothetical protein
MPFDARFRNPSTFILAGSSQSGKTTLTFNILRHIDTLFQDPRCKQNVIYFYNKWQSSYDSFKKENIVKEWINKLPTEEDVEAKTLLSMNHGGSVLVIDDFAQELTRDIIKLFGVLAHHTNSVVILLTQNIFAKVKGFRDISINANYVILFKNPRDTSQIANFARQVARTDSTWINEAFEEATSKAYSYLLFDFHQTTPPQLKVRSCILPDDKDPMICWLKKGHANV